MKKLFSIAVCCILLFSHFPAMADERQRGIYISQYTIENTKYLTYLIQRAKEVGINTFIIDIDHLSKRYAENVRLVEDNNINYVARVVVFPEGGYDEQIRSPAYWKTRLKLAEQAIALGAKAIQLDYIRYRSTQPASSENSKNIYKVINWFKVHLETYHNTPLQIDVFGIATFGESKHIGQNLKLFADTVDAMCPMLYPSHFEPYKVHAVQPYRTIYNALHALRIQLDNVIPFKVYPYIEMTNYRYWHPANEIQGYIYAQIKATEDAGTDGWYAWSAANKYDNLFALMKKYPVKV